MSAPGRSDPREYDYSNPVRSCDMVMKGGITSGVVYPHAVCELARTYRFRSVGGASAGAIAAAATAAAELGRESGGFKRFAELPQWLGENMFSVFQPQPGTRGLFALLTAAVTHGKWRRPRLLWTALRSFPLFPLLAALPGIALVVVGVAGTGGGARVAVIVGGLLLALVGAALGLLYGILRSATHAVPANYFGLCSGMPGAEKGAAAPLTVWLGELLETLADRDPAGPPLTFRELWHGDEPDATPRSIRLEMMTTNLTNRRPHRLPWNERVFLFDPAEFRDLFPERVVEWMLAHPAAPRERGPKALRESELRERLLDPLRPWPGPGDLPVVVAARMSLSFPLLISAVPLWSVDMSTESNQRAAAAWEEWLEGHADDWERIKDDRSQWRDTPGEALVAERCWFSDGGISSNFPVHFFDAPVPVRPTFAIDLTGFGPGEDPDPDETENVWLPPNNQGGLLETWYRFHPSSGPRQLAGFGSAVVRTMQNRVDSAQMRVPGYRDRIVHVKFTGTEGGMNLTMPARVITALTLRGQAAGAKLVQRFHLPPREPGELSWDNHRWIRFRSSLAVLGELVERFASGYSRPPEVAGERTYAELAARGDEPPSSYRWRNARQQTLAAEATRQVVALADALSADEESVADAAPSPQPEARIVPRV